MSDPVEKALLLAFRSANSYVRIADTADIELPEFGSQVLFVRISERWGRMSKLGEKIYKLRRAKGLTLDELATRIGASKSSLWELENKPVARPSAERIEKLAQELHVTTSFLLNDNLDEPTEDVADAAFFRKYEKLDSDTKKKLQQILKVLDSES